LAGGAATGCFPLYGIVKNVSADTQPVAPMKHIASAIRINVTNGTSEGITIDEVEFTAPEAIVGNFYISFDKEPLTITPYASQAAATAALKVNNPTVLAAGATAAFYMGIKPFTAKANDVLAIKVKVGDTVFEKSLTLPSAVEFKSGSIKNLNVTYTGGTEIQGSTLEEIAAMSTGSDVQTQEVLVVGKYARGIMLGQNGAFLLAFNTSGVTGAVGDIVTVSGKVGEYGGLKQITSPEVTVISSGNEVVLPEPKVLDGAAIDAYESTKIELIQYVGTLKVSGTYYNVEVSGATKKGSIQYPLNTEALTALKDKTVTATGFFTGITGSSTKYVNMMSTSVEEAAVNVFDVTPQQIDVAASETSTQITVSGNVEWTAEASEGATIDKVSGTGNDVITVSFAANTTPDPKEYTVFVRTTATGVNDEFAVEITQAAASTEAKAYPFEETFENGQGDFSINNVTLGEGLTYVWKHDSSNKYMKASAYAGSSKESESWLISPLVDLTGATEPRLYFSQCINKFFGNVAEEATVWIKEEGGEWAQLTISYPEITSGNWSKMTDYTVDIKSYAGKKVQVAFKYTSSTTAAGTWEIKNFKLAEYEAPALTFGATLATANVAATATEATVNVTGNVAWTASVTSGATVNPASGTGEGSITVTFPANTDSQNTKTYTVTVSTTENVENKSIDLTITQAKADAAGTVTIDWTSYTEWTGVSYGTSGTVGSEEISLVKGDYLVTIKKNNGSTNPNVHGVANDARAYAKATVTVKNTKNVNIETLVFDISEQGLKRLAPITASVGTVATQASGDNTVSWSGEATEVTFTVGDKANYGSDGAEKAGQLCFNDIKVTEGGQGQSSFGATLAEANVAATATEATVNVTGNVAWTASVTLGATVNPASGTGEGAVTVTFPANTDTENSKTYTVTLTTTADVPTKTIQLVITQAKAGGAVTDVLNQKFTGISGSSYTDFSGKTGASGAVYAGQCAGSNSSIQLRSKNNNCGIVTTDTGGKAKKVTVIWESHTMEGRTLNIYGKNTAYSSASDLYDDAKQGTLLGSITYGTSTEVTISGDYTYIGFRSAADAMYLSEVQIVWE
jgi:hypothetical protein